MSDVFSKRKRSAVMTLIRSRSNAATELRLIAVFRAHGIVGWRRGAVISNQRSVIRIQRSEVGSRRTEGGSRPAGSEPTVRFAVRPDFVFRALRLAVFVDGCFWHGCPSHATQPKQNAKFWRTKIAANKARDRFVNRTLRAHGWRVMRVWEHELTKKNKRRLLVRLRCVH